MYVYILIAFLIIIFINYNTKTKENFENCYLNVGNKQANGDTTFFTNFMKDTYFNRNDTLDNLQNEQNETIKTVETYQKNVFDSNDEYNRLNDQYNTLNNDIENQFNKLTNDVNAKIEKASTLKQTATTQFNNIDANMNRLVNASTLENRLVPLVNSAIENNLNQISNNAVDSIPVLTMFNNRRTDTRSNINTWQNVPGLGAPMRIDPNTGNAQCLSYDGRNCVWNNSNLSQIRHNDVRPLTCGEDHRRNWGSTGYDTPGHWCNTVHNHIAQNNIDQVDWSRCPIDWTNNNSEGTQCTAPADYRGRCSRTSVFNGYSPQGKQQWAAGCTARWPFKLNTVNQLNNQSNVINDTVNSRIGNFTNTTVLSQFNTYDNGVYVVAYRLGPNNSRGAIIKEGILTTNVNFNWGVGLIFGIRDNATQTNTDQIFMELTGFIKTPVNVSTIRFRLTSDDGSRLIFSTNQISNMRMIIDMWRPQGATSRESEVLTVQPDSYLPFQIQFFEQFGAATLRLEWSINGGGFVIIPREAFYINRELCSYKFNFNYVQEIGARVNSVVPQVPPRPPPPPPPPPTTPRTWTFTFGTGVYANTSAPTQASLSDGFWDRANSVWGSFAVVRPFIIADFGTLITINSITVGPISPGFGGWGWNYLNGASLEYSRDGANYFVVANINQPNTSQMTRTYPGGFQARFVRIIYNDNQQRYLGVGTFTFT